MIYNKIQKKSSIKDDRFLSYVLVWMFRILQFSIPCHHCFYSEKNIWTKFFKNSKAWFWGFVTFNHKIYTLSISPASFVNLMKYTIHLTHFHKSDSQLQPSCLPTLPQHVPQRHPIHTFRNILPFSDFSVSSL